MKQDAKKKKIMLWLLPPSISRAYKKSRVCKICAMKHPTGLDGYVLRWKVGQAAHNSKVGDSHTIKTNFAEMDMKSWHQKSSVFALSQLKSPMQRPRGKFQHLQCLIIVVKAASSKTT